MKGDEISTVVYKKPLSEVRVSIKIVAEGETRVAILANSGQVMK